MDKNIMYPEAPPTGYVALVGLPVLLQLHAIMEDSYGYTIPLYINCFMVDNSY